MGGMRHVDLTRLSEDEKAALTAQMVKGQQLAGHYPDARDADRFERLLAGEITLEAAWDEVFAEIAAMRPTPPPT